MASTIALALRQIKSDVARFVRPDVIGQICTAVGHAWRKRVLDPVTTLRVFLLQVLHGNTACNEMPHRLNDVSFTGAAYCAARARLPLQLFEQLLARMGAALQNTLAEHGWRGHRTWLLDGSSFSMSDTPALQAHFGQPSGSSPTAAFALMRTWPCYCSGKCTASFASTRSKSSASSRDDLTPVATMNIARVNRVRAGYGVWAATTKSLNTSSRHSGRPG